MDGIRSILREEALRGTDRCSFQQEAMVWAAQK